MDQNRIPGLRLLISNLPDSASRTHVDWSRTHVTIQHEFSTPCLVNLISRLSPSILYLPASQGIRINHGCEDGIEKSVSRITDWHLEACRVMTNGDRGEQFVYALLTRITDYFSCSQLNTSFYIGIKREKRLHENPEYVEMRHRDVIFNITMTVFTVDVRPACGRRAAVRCLPFPRAGMKRKSRSGVRAKCFSLEFYFVKLSTYSDLS